MTDSLTTIWFKDYDFGVGMEDVKLETWHTEQKINDMMAAGVMGSRLNTERLKLRRLERELKRLLASLNVDEGSLIQLDGQVVLVLKEGWMFNGKVYEEALELFADCEAA
jgi:hypothetical protein